MAIVCKHFLVAFLRSDHRLKNVTVASQNVGMPMGPGYAYSWSGTDGHVGERRVS